MERKRAVAVIVENNNKILMGKKKRGSSETLSGEWHLPGETVEDNETDEQAIVRGLHEEAGIEIEVIRFLDSHITPKGTLVNWYLCRSDNLNLIAGSDLEEVRWVTIPDVEKLSGLTAKSLWPEQVKKLLNL